MLLLSLVVVSSDLGWWVSSWVCVLAMEIVACMGYSGVSIANCSCGGLFNCDEVSCAMIWLSAFITGLSLLGSGKILSLKNGESGFLLCLLVLMCVVVICFSVNS